MYESRLRLWLIFSAWVTVAALAAYSDHASRRTIVLPVFLVLSFVAAYWIFRGQRPSSFKFQPIAGEGRAVRSLLGFEVHVKGLSIQYREGERVLSLQSQPPSRSAQVFSLKMLDEKTWESPFETESISEEKRKQIFRSVIAALAFMQAQEQTRRHRP
jgi:hypothetical protein